MSSRPSLWSRLAAWFKAYGRWVLLTFGVVALVGLINHVGPRELWAVLVTAGPWLPIILLLEMIWISVDGLALLVFFGSHRRRIPPRVWVRSLMVHYMTMAVLPVGRAGAEVARATMLAPHVGNQRAAAGAAQIQSATLVGNAIICLPCLIAVAYQVGWSSTALPYLLLVNMVGTASVGLGLYVFLRKARIGGWLGKKFARMSHWGPELDQVLRDTPRGRPAFLLTAAGRAMQTLQYGIILLAVGGTLTFESALMSQGIHLVGAFFGDLVPTQIGVTEGAYSLFAQHLGLGDAPARALAIAIIARISAFAVAAISFLGIWLWPVKPVLLESGDGLPAPTLSSRSSTDPKV